MTDDTAPFEPQLDGFPSAGDASREAGRDSLEMIISDLVERHRRGEDPDLREYSRRHPHLAAELEELLPAIAAMEQWKLRQESDILRARIAGDTLPEQIGRCRILRRIGSGGMGVVFEARHETLEGAVAVKLLPSKFSRDSTFRRRFEQEARTAGRLRHPHIVPVLEHGEHDGFCYYVMPCVPAVSLRWLLGRLAEGDGVVYAEDISRACQGEAVATAGSPATTDETADVLEPDTRQNTRQNTRQEQHGSVEHSARRLERQGWQQLARIVLQVAGALHFAHRRRVIHRDIKPENLLLDAGGQVWITDFGVAGPPVEAAAADTDSPADGSLSRNLVGTLKYMAPERFEGACDRRSDLYSLGLTLYELLSLTYPFPAETRSELVEAICRTSPVPVEQLVPELPAPLAAITGMLLARDPALRYPSARALMIDLRRFLRHQPLKYAVPREARSKQTGWFRKLLSRGVLPA